MTKIDYDTLMFVLNSRGITFSMTEASKIVGGRGRLLSLIANREIRCTKGSSQNSRMAVNAWDCLLFAKRRVYTIDMRKKRWRDLKKKHEIKA